MHQVILQNLHLMIVAKTHLMMDFFSAYVVVVAEGFEAYKSYVNWKPKRSAEGPSLSLDEPFVLLKLKPMQLSKKEILLN